MKALLLATLWVFDMACAPARAQVKLGQSTTVVFATVEQARAILTARDDFVQRMSPFDRAARMKTNSDVSEEDFLKFAGKNVLAWDDAEKEKMTSVFQGLQAELEAL